MAPDTLDTVRMEMRMTPHVDLFTRHFRSNAATVRHRAEAIKFCSFRSRGMFAYFLPPRSLEGLGSR